MASSRRHPNPNEGPPSLSSSPGSDHPDDEVGSSGLGVGGAMAPPPIHRRPLHPPPPGAPPPHHGLGGPPGALASKPHAFGGAVLSPDHARNLSTDLALQLASALSVQASHAASARGVLPPGEQANVFRGSELVDALLGWGAGGSKGAIGGTGGGTSGGGVFRGPPPPASAPNTPKSTPGQPSARVISLLAHGHAPPTPSRTSTPGLSTPGATSVSLSSVGSHVGSVGTPGSTTDSSAAIPPLSLLSTAEALDALGGYRTHYTTWITEAWTVLRWSEPTAALFWEMATMFHTLYVASLSVRGGGSGDVVRGSLLGAEGGGNVSGGGAGATLKSSSAAATTTPPATSAGTYIPPLLSCGSQSSMGSVRSSGQHSLDPTDRTKDPTSQAHHPLGTPSRTGGAMKPARHSARELPVWLISMFLLVHCAPEAYCRCTSAEDERRFADGHRGDPSAATVDGGDGSLDFAALVHHRTLSPRTRLHAGMHQDNAPCAAFLLRHLRKFMLLCAVPRNVAACKAVATLAAKGSDGTAQRASMNRYAGAGGVDVADIERQHAREHGTIGLTIELTVEELDRLHLVVQAPSGGLVDDPPVAIGEHILRCLAAEEAEAREGRPGNAPPSHRWNLMQNGLITVADAERVLRRYLEEELALAKQEMDGEEGDGASSAASDEVTHKLSKMALAGIAPVSPPRSRGVSVASDADAAKDASYLKELSYQKLRSTTVLLEPGRDAATTTSEGALHDAGSVADSQNDQQSQTSKSSHSGHQLTNALQPDPANENGRLHDLHVADCSDTHFYLLQPFEHATIAACTDCTIVLGAVAGLLHVVDCERTTITAAARRVVVSNSFDVVHYLFTPSPPLLVGDNRGCQFAPYNTYYEGLREDLLSTGLAAVLRSAHAPPSGSGSVAGEAPTAASPGRSASPSGAPPTLQCASNKWKVPVELCKIEVPQLPNVSTPGSPGNLESASGSLSPGADDRALGGSVDVAMKTPVLLPSSEFDVLLVPVESEEARMRRQMQREQAEAAASANHTDEAASSDAGGDEGGETTTVYSTASSLTGITGDRERNEQPPPPLESDYCRILADLLTLSPFHMPHDYERRVIAKAEKVRALQQAIAELNAEQRANLEEELNRGFQDWLVTSGNLRQVLDLVHLERRVPA